MVLNHFMLCLLQSKKQLWIQRNGATLALTAITRESGPELVDKMPNLWEALTETLQKVGSLGKYK